MITEVKALPDAEYFRQIVPVSEELRKVKEAFDNELKENFVSREKFVVICGPCAADDEKAMDEYVTKLSNVANSCPDLLIAARVYTTKPHSNGQGYLGACFHQTSFDAVNIAEGIVRCRKMMRRCLEVGLPIADELLYPDLYEYFQDLVSYWFVGARSSENSLLRGVASGLDVCCGIKNGTDGDVDKAVDSVYAVSNSCVYPYCGRQIVTNGCKYSHLTLRGGIKGTKGEQTFVGNIDARSVSRAKLLLKRYGLNDFVMADLSHANSGKIAKRQIENAKLVADNPDINGVMIESYLYEGEKSTQYGVSQTDDCLSFDDTVGVLEYLQRVISMRND